MPLLLMSLMPLPLLLLLTLMQIQIPRTAAALGCCDGIA
jgi:hypothetical protein